MIFWLEAQSVATIVLLGYALCFALAVLVFAAGCAMSRSRLAEGLHSVSPSLVTPVGVIFGLLLVFLSSRVWTNVDRAHVFASQEASALRELVRVSENLPSVVRDPIRLGVNAYIGWVEQDDWPRMLAGQGVIRSKLPGLGEATAALASFNSIESGQRSLQQEALAAIEKIRDARRGRILLSKTYVGTGQWLVVFVLFVHLLLLNAVLHLKRLVSMAFAIGITASAFAICLVLLLMYDRPFRQGGVTVEPVGLEDMRVD